MSAKCTLIVSCLCKCKNWAAPPPDDFGTHHHLSACPLTIHALLHVVDGMEAAGPVWTYWAFPTERFCGRLLPEIRSQRHPFSNIDNFVVASAKLSQIKIMYNLDEELSLRPRKAEVLHGSFSHPSCTLLSSCSTQTTFLTTIPLLDPRYVLLPPQCPSSTIPQSVDNKIAIHFATRFSQNINIVRWYLKWENITQWARVQRLAGGGMSCMHRSCSPKLRTVEMLRMFGYVCTLRYLFFN